MILDKRYVVYTPSNLEDFKRGIKHKHLLKPLFTDSLAEAKEYNDKNKGSVVLLKKDIYYVKILDIIELYSYLSSLRTEEEKSSKKEDKVEVEPEVLKKEPESLEEKPKKRRGRPKKIKEGNNQRGKELKWEKNN